MCVLCMFVSQSPVNCECFNIARDVCAVYVCVPEPCELWMFKYCQRCVCCVCLCPWALWTVNVSILPEMCVLCMFVSQSPVNCECLNIARDVCAVYVCVPEPRELWMFKYCQRCVCCVCLCPRAPWSVNVSILTEMRVLCMFVSLSPVNCECLNIARDVCAVYVCVPEPREVYVSILTEMRVLCMFVSLSPVKCECFNIARDVCAVYVCVPEPCELWMFKYCQRCVSCVCLCPWTLWTVNV